MTISICISTFGADHWRVLAQTRALPSAERQEVEVVVEHQPQGTIGTSRNAAAEKASGEWLIFLDADDELAPDFVSAMRRAYEQAGGDDGTPRLFTPAVSYLSGRRTKQQAKIWPECEMHLGNWLVVSTMMQRSLFLEVGGFRDYGDPPGSIGYEDWALMSLLVQAGAEIVKVPEAVLLAHWGPRSRNRSATPAERNRWHYEIGRDVWPEHYPENWLVNKHGYRGRTIRGRRR